MAWCPVDEKIELVRLYSDITYYPDKLELFYHEQHKCKKEVGIHGAYGT